MKYLDPKADLTLKKVFGEHPDLMVSLLNALLPFAPGQEITAIEYLPWEIVPENPLRKNTVIDVCCRDKEGKQFLAEVQMIWSSEFNQRVLLNASNAYVYQIGKRKNYELLQPVYSLNLTNEIFEPELEGYYHYYPMVHMGNSNKVIDGLQLIFIELPKFIPHTYSEKKMHVLWLRYLTEINEKTVEIPGELLANTEVNKAVKELEVSAFTPAQLSGYEKFWDIISVEKTLLNSAERRGFAKGLEEGLAKSKEEGEKKKQQEITRKIARKMKAKGFSTEDIIDLTSLAAEEVVSL